MHCLIYVSAAKRQMTEDELADLLRACRKNNQRNGITGMLLYKDGDFMQVLEGKEETVKQLYAKIKTDARHHMVTQIVERKIDSRTFGDWSMGFRILRRGDLEKLPGFTGFIDRSFTEKEHLHPDLAHKLMLQFAHRRW